MSDDAPLGAVAVVIPAYQAERFLAEAIESVLAQDHPVAEIVVVDDGSTDAGAAVAERYAPRVVVLRQPNTGAGAARRHGLGATSAPLVAFLDADDRWRPDAARRLATALGERPDALLAYGASAPFVDPTAAATGRPLANRAGPGPALLTSTTLIRRRAFDLIGPFGDDNFSSMDWFARTIETGAESVAVDHVVTDRRLHDANTSTTTPGLTLAYARVLKASLDRRRRAPGP